MKTFWTLWEDLNNAVANQPAPENNAPKPEKKQEFKQLELVPTKDFDVREKARKDVGDGFNILKDSIPGPIRKRMETDLGSDDLDTIYGVGDQMNSMRLQHPLMDVINDRGRGERHKDSEVLKRFNKIQDLKRDGGSKKELSPFFKMKQELKGGADGFVEKIMEQFPNINVSQSSEIMADMRGEDGLQSNDVLHHFLPEINEVMGDMPAHIQDKFSRYLQDVQYRYKTGGDYGSIIDQLCKQIVCLACKRKSGITLRIWQNYWEKYNLLLLVGKTTKRNKAYLGLHRMSFWLTTDLFAQFTQKMSFRIFHTYIRD